MANELNPFQKIQKANDDYHEAVNEVMSDENVPVETKAQLGGMLNCLFSSMLNVRQLVRPLYE